MVLAATTKSKAEQYHARVKSEPVLSFQNSIALRDAAQAKGVPVESGISKGAGHGFAGASIAPSAEEINRHTVEFFAILLTGQ